MAADSADPADPTSVRPDDAELTDLVDQAMQAHFAGGEPALAAFCAGLGRHGDVVLQRLAALRRLGLFGEPAADADAPADELRRLGDFELIEPLGRGGMGVVYRARQITLDREVAVKIIRPEQLHFPDVRERFRREVEIVAKLHHEGVVQLYSVGEDRGIPWFAMEYVRGASLANVIESLAAKRLPDPRGEDLRHCLPGEHGDGPPAPLFEGDWVDVAVRIVERAAAALDQAHQQGVLHRDIKPSNIMVTASGRVVLLDFGLAWTPTVDRLTRSGAELGTIHYMAPEQFRGAAARIDERTDVYALGVVLRELVTLRSVFTGATVDEVARQVREGLCAPFGGPRSSMRRDVETICLVAMDRDPQRRYASARLLARDLRCVLERRPIEAVRPSWPVRLRRLAQRHRTLAFASSAVVLALLMTPVVVALRERGLRLELQVANSSLETQIRRADHNLALATNALAEILKGIEEEQLSAVPDLAGFVDRALTSSATCIDALATSNPEDPTGRLQLAQALARVAFVQWSYYEMARPEPLFVRALELLEGSQADRDQVDALELEVRLALVYVRRLAPEASIAAYQEALARVRRAGAPATRAIPLRVTIANCLHRCGILAVKRDEAQGMRMLEEAAALRDSIAAHAPSVDSCVEVAFSAQQLAEEYGRHQDAAAVARLEVKLDAALVAAEGLAKDAPVASRERLQSLLYSLAIRWNAQPARAAPFFERAEELARRNMQQRPSRVAGVLSWGDIVWRLATSYEKAGRVDDAFAASSGSLRYLRAVAVTRSDDPVLLRTAMAGLRRHVQLVRRHPGAGAAIDIDGLLDEAVAMASRVDALEPKRAAVHDECRRVHIERARRRLQVGRPAEALADATTAGTFESAAKQMAVVERVNFTFDASASLLQAEALLQLGRDDEALARLSGITGLPADLLEQVPSLRSRSSDARFAALLQQGKQAR